MGRLSAIAFEELLHTVLALPGILQWRGIWGPVKSFVMVVPRKEYLGWTFHILSIVLLLALQTVNSITPTGCKVDGENNMPEALIFPTAYFPKCFQSLHSQVSLKHRSLKPLGYFIR